MGIGPIEKTLPEFPSPLLVVAHNLVEHVGVKPTKVSLQGKFALSTVMPQTLLFRLFIEDVEKTWRKLEDSNLCDLSVVLVFKTSSSSVRTASINSQVQLFFFVIERF